MDRPTLQAVLATSRRSNGQGLAADALALLGAMQPAAASDGVADLLADLRPHREALRRALSGDLRSALAALDADPPLRAACAALVERVDGRPAQPAALSVNLSAQSGTIAGSPVSVVQHADSVTFPVPADPAAARREAALITYLRRTMAECNALPLGQIDRTDADHIRPIELARVYIGLNTRTSVDLTDAEIAELPEDERRRIRNAGAHGRGDRPTRPLSALETLVHGDGRVMLLGAPGGGKSTFLSHLALCLAGDALSSHRAGERQPEGGWLACLPRWGNGALLPVRIILRDLAAFAPLAEAPRGSVRLLEEFLAATLAEAGCADARDLLVGALQEGEALLMLDGLDEVVGQPVLQRVVEAIADAGRTYRAPAIVTCRILDYQEEPARQLKGFATYTLAELDEGQIQQFVQDWYRELAASGRRPAPQAAADAAILGQAVGTRSELRALAGTPLLLTVMALVHAFRGALPDARSLLYAECIDLLLLRWRQPRGEADLLERLGLSQFRSSDLLALMAQLGYEAHAGAERSQDDTRRPADLGEDQVIALLAEGFARYDEPRKYELAGLMLTALTKGNGLLLKRGPQVYTFAHRTFQEHLAGVHLKGQKDYRKLCLERADKPHWHEALTLMVGYQVLQDRELEKPLDLAEKLLERSPIEQALAGELLNLIGRERALAYDPALLQRPGGLWHRGAQRLFALLTKGEAPAAPATLRARAGLALGLLCYGPVEELGRPAAQVPLPDPRLPFALIGQPAQRSPGWQKTLESYWCAIEPGEFWSGDDRPPQEDKSQVKRAVAAVGRVLREQGGTERKTREPLRRARIERLYKIARYPVTNADFARFLAAGGYHERRWWDENGWAFLEPGGQRFSSDIEGRITKPRLWDDLHHNGPIQPVVGISWYEATAYCRWLTAQGHSNGWLPPDQVIRLPTWHEWERAARHTDRRPHPWGDEPPDPERANYDDTDIGVTSPVGCFPMGAAVCDAQDMLGGATEWTLSRAKGRGVWKDDASATDDVVCHFSAYFEDASKLFCGAYIWYAPSLRGIGLGFRVVHSRALIE